MNKHIFNIKKNKRGAALISALMCLVILGIICSGFMQSIVKDNKFSQSTIFNTITLYTAEAGLEYGKWLVKHNLSYYPARNIRTYKYTTSGNLTNATTPSASTNEGKMLAGSVYNLWGTAFLYDYSSSIINEELRTNLASSTPLRSCEFVYMSDLSFEDDNVSGRRNNLGKNTYYCLSSFVLAAKPYNNTVSGNYSGSDVWPNSSLSNGLPVGLSSTGHIWALPKTGTFVNGVGGSGGSYLQFMNQIGSSTLYDQGFRLRTSRTVNCQFTHGCALASQSGRTDAPSDPALTEYFTNYGEWYR
ncbi:hypothetical protein IJT93_13425 [bacterium]|nr:hypothetical protein [bacterium]